MDLLQALSQDLSFPATPDTDSRHSTILTPGQSCISLHAMQATFASAEVRAKTLAEMQQADAAEVEKLLQRQQAAEAQYDQGLSKLRATARQLQSLASRVRVLQCWCLAA